MYSHEYRVVLIEIADNHISSWRHARECAITLTIELINTDADQLLGRDNRSSRGRRANLGMIDSNPRTSFDVGLGPPALGLFLVVEL
jgi:hypothetical protein